MDEKNVELSLLYDHYGELLTQKQREAFDLYYNEDLSLSEIASHSGISRQGVREQIKNAQTQLLEYEKKLGLAEKHDLTARALALLIEAAKSGDCEKVRMLAARIKDLQQ